MKFSLRSDPAFDAGLGHLSRLIALGQELSACGYSYCFHPFGEFPARHVEFISNSLLDVECRCNGKPDFTIVDTYNPGIIKWMTQFRSGLLIQLLDEVTPRGKCDGYVEVSPISQITNRSENTPILKFEDSPLFRDEIFSLKDELGREGAPGERGILVLGGVDDSTYIKVLTFLTESLGDKVRDLTLGTSSMEVIEIARNMGVISSCSSQEMSYIAKNFSYVISGAGVTAWELAFLRIPGFVISVADNQEFQLDYLKDNGYRNGVSLLSNTVKADFLDCLQAINEDPKKFPGENGRQIILNFLRGLSLQTAPLLN